MSQYDPSAMLDPDLAATANLRPGMELLSMQSLVKLARNEITTLLPHEVRRQHIRWRASHYVGYLHRGGNKLVALQSLKDANVAWQPCDQCGEPTHCWCEACEYVYENRTASDPTAALDPRSAPVCTVCDAAHLTCRQCPGFRVTWEQARELSVIKYPDDKLFMLHPEDPCHGRAKLIANPTTPPNLPDFNFHGMPYSWKDPPDKAHGETDRQTSSAASDGTPGVHSTSLQAEAPRQSTANADSDEEPWHLIPEEMCPLTESEDDE